MTMPSMDRRAMLLGAAATVAALPARAQSLDSTHRLADRLRRLSADGLDPSWYAVPPREAAMGDTAGYTAAVQSAARQALQDLLHGRAQPPAGRIDVRRDMSQVPLQPWLAEMQSGDAVAVLDRASDATPGAAAIKRTLAESEARAARGALPQVPTGGTIEPGRSDAVRVPALRARLAATDPALAATPVADPARYDESLQAAVRRFQSAAGLEADARVGGGTQAALNRTAAMDALSLRVALDMRRAATQPGRDRRIDVNIPDFMLHVREGDRAIMDMPVIVGRPARATPLLATRMTSVQFNPPWGVPQRNAVEDKLPLLQRNPLALQRSGTRIFQRVEGEIVEVDPTTVDWRSFTRDRFPFFLRQDPGEANALGRLKFIMPNSEDIFMHDTPDRNLFARGERAFSSGCIRLGAPMDFLVLAMEGLEGWDRARMQSSIAAGRTFTIALRRQPPVRLLYNTVVVETDRVRVRPDIYGLDRAWWAAMERGAARPMAARS